MGFGSSYCSVVGFAVPNYNECPWVVVAAPSKVVCVSVALVAFSVSSPILVDGAATNAVVVASGT